MLELGTLVTNCDKDLGIVLGHWEDPHDGYLYLKVKWFDDEKVELVEPCCLEVIA